MKSPFGVVHKKLPAALRPLTNLPRQTIKRRFRGPNGKSSDPITPGASYVNARITTHVSGKWAGPGRAFKQFEDGSGWYRTGIPERGWSGGRTKVKSALAALQKPGKYESKRAAEIRSVREQLAAAKAAKRKLMGQ